MIQRIQTIYLLIAEILIGTLFFVPLAEITGKEGILYRFQIQGIFMEGLPGSGVNLSSWPLIILLVLSIILILVTTFMFRNRILQMRLAKIAVFTLVALSVLIYYYVISVTKILAGHYSMSIFSVILVIAPILVYLAIRAIKKDELLVRSIDRIR